EFIRPPVGHGEQEHFAGEEALQVVLEIGCLLLLLHYENGVAQVECKYGGCDNGVQASGCAPDMNSGRTGRTYPCGYGLDHTLRGIQVQKIMRPQSRLQ